MKYIIKIVFFSSLICLAAPIYAESATPTLQVSKYVDRGAAGWAWKENDLAYEIKLPGCYIKWNAITPNDEASQQHNSQGKYLLLRNECPLPFKQQLPYHRAILRTIHADTPITSFVSLTTGPFCPHDDSSWCRPIAIASSRSADYQDYVRHYANARINSPNAVFVQLANETTAYADLVVLFKELGAVLKLQSVEKVFTAKAGSLTYFETLQASGVSAGTRVMFDVGMAHFAIEETGQ
jgi:hypothetical protein